jgi:hypothetical protein
MHRQTRFSLLTSLADFGVPERIRTSDLRFRKPLHEPMVSS